jgi:hypothetical protein
MIRYDMIVMILDMMLYDVIYDTILCDISIYCLLIASHCLPIMAYLQGGPDGHGFGHEVRGFHDLARIESAPLVRQLR